jgi:hypothetical protein
MEPANERTKMSDNIAQLPGIILIAPYTQVDDGQYTLTDRVLKDPQQYRRLVRTQIEELLTMYRSYPLPEFEAVRQILTQMQRAYSDVEPFNHPMRAEMYIDADEDDCPVLR